MFPSLVLVVIMLHVMCKARCTMSKLQENSMLNILNVSELGLKKSMNVLDHASELSSYVPKFYEQPTLKG